MALKPSDSSFSLLQTAPDPALQEGWVRGSPIPLVFRVISRARNPPRFSILITRLELGPQQQNICFAWLVANKPDPKKAKVKGGTNSGEECREDDSTCVSFPSVWSPGWGWETFSIKMISPRLDRIVPIWFQPGFKNFKGDHLPSW